MVRSSKIAAIFLVLSLLIVAGGYFPFGAEYVGAAGGNQGGVGGEGTDSGADGNTGGGNAPGGNDPGSDPSDSANDPSDTSTSGNTQSGTQSNPGTTGESTTAEDNSGTQPGTNPGSLSDPSAGNRGSMSEVDVESQVDTFSEFSEEGFGTLSDVLSAAKGLFSAVPKKVDDAKKKAQKTKKDLAIKAGLLAVTLGFKTPQQLADDLTDDLDDDLDEEDLADLVDTLNNPVVEDFARNNPALAAEIEGAIKSELSEGQINDVIGALSGISVDKGVDSFSGQATVDGQPVGSDATPGISGQHASGALPSPSDGDNNPPGFFDTFVKRFLPGGNNSSPQSTTGSAVSKQLPPQLDSNSQPGPGGGGPAPEFSKNIPGSGQSDPGGKLGGSFCNSDSQCASGNCNHGLNICEFERGSGSSSGGANSSLGAGGEFCDQDDDCRSGNCDHARNQCEPESGEQRSGQVQKFIGDFEEENQELLQDLSDVETFDDLGEVVQQTAKNSQQVQDFNALTAQFEALQVQQPVEISFIVDETRVEEGGSVVLSWNVDNATACRAFGGAGWFGLKNTQGTETVSNITSSVSLSLRCGNSGTNVRTKSVFVRVVGEPLPDSTESGLVTEDDSGTNPNIDLSISRRVVPYGEGVLVTWSTQDVITCIAGDDWPRPQALLRGEHYKSLSGSEFIPFVDQDLILTLSCFDGNGEIAEDSVFVTVVAPEG